MEHNVTKSQFLKYKTTYLYKCLHEKTKRLELY